MLRFGLSPLTRQRYRVLRLAALGGTAFLAGLAPGTRVEHLHFLSAPYQPLRHLELLLHHGLRFSSWRAFLSGDEQARSDAIEAHLPESLPQLLAAGALQAPPPSDVVELVSAVRSQLTAHLGLRLQTHHKMIRGQKLQRYSFQPQEWAWPAAEHAATQLDVWQQRILPALRSMAPVAWS